MSSGIPVIAIDGPTASGKGTVAQKVAARLGFHYLDSGSLYRLVGLAAARSSTPMHDAPALAALAQALDVRFEGDRIRLSGEDVSEAIRTEEAGQNASKVAAIPSVREALMHRQRAFRQAPGLVADGRDMGSVVFPDARPKFFLTASVEARGMRPLRPALCPVCGRYVIGVSLPINPGGVKDLISAAVGVQDLHGQIFRCSWPWGSGLQRGLPGPTMGRCASPSSAAASIRRTSPISSLACMRC